MSHYRKAKRLGGLIARDGFYRSPVSVPPMPPSVSPGNRDWFDEIAATAAQSVPSCVGRATGQLLTCLIRREFGPDAIPAGHGIHGDLIWRAARMFYYAGRMNGGLLLHEGLAAAEALGLIQPYELVRLPLDISEIDRWLGVTPIIQGTSTWPAWDIADQQNGQIASGPPDQLAGHATMIVDVQRRGGRNYCVFANSWGVEWGRHGYGTLTEAQWRIAQLDHPVGVIFPNGIGEGWRKAVAKL